MEGTTTIRVFFFFNYNDVFHLHFPVKQSPLVGGDVAYSFPPPPDTGIFYFMPGNINKKKMTFLIQFILRRSQFLLAKHKLSRITFVKSNA
jgi:hypothetical protein